ncbi:MAG: HAD family hydrolase [Mollicutes bacterium PWAP]|nr:HAD family hydrolase [Mollicutes bacterium PWAP]
MKKKLFLFDVDGTLSMGDENIHPETHSAILEAKNKGHTVAISSGRSRSDMLSFEEKYGLIFDYYVCNNGSYIFNVFTKEAFNKKVLPYSVLKHLNSFAIANDTFLTVCTLSGKLKFFSGDINKTNWINSNNDWLSKSQKSINFDEQLTEFQKQNITQISLSGSKEDIIKAFKHFNNILGNKTKFFISNEVYLDCNNLNANKFNGSNDLRKMLSISMGNTFVFGDSDNDLEMLSGFKNSFAMGNATINAKKVAKKIIGKNTTNAISKIILQNI